MNLKFIEIYVDTTRGLETKTQTQTDWHPANKAGLSSIFSMMREKYSKGFIKALQMQTLKNLEVHRNNENKLQKCGDP